MKGIGVLFTGLVLCSCAVGFGQSVADNAVGIRLGDDDGLSSLGLEISYQRALERKGRRLEFNLAFRNGAEYNAFKLLGQYQWVEPLDGNFHWYYGAGLGLGNVDYEGEGGNNRSFILLTGDLGIEYDFDAPLLLFMDLRPEIGLGSDGYGSGLDFDLGFGIRYQF